MSATKKTTTSKKAPAKPSASSASKRSASKTSASKTSAPRTAARKSSPRKAARPKAARRDAAAKPAGATLVVRQVRSAIGSNRRQRATLRGLRLGRPGRRSELEDTQAVRGMIRAVIHLVTVEGA